MAANGPIASWLQLIYAATSLAAVSNLGLLHRLVVIPEYRGWPSSAALPDQAQRLAGSFRSGWLLGWGWRIEEPRWPGSGVRPAPGS